MTVDPRIKEAIDAAVEEAGQSQPLSRKLIRWFEAIASGNEDINDRQSAGRHLELLYEETQTPAGLSDSELDDIVDELSEGKESS